MGGGGEGGGGYEKLRISIVEGWLLILPKPTEADNSRLDLHNFISREGRILSELFHYSLKVFPSS